MEIYMTLVNYQIDLRANVQLANCLIISRSLDVLDTSSEVTNPHMPAELHVLRMDAMSH